MRTVESVVARSSRELWADICAALPGADQVEDAREAFADSFAGADGSSGSPAEAPGGPARAPPKPWAPLQDSAVYLASLERRLMRIKGLSQEVTSKDMLHTLAQAKKECWNRFLQEKFESEFYIEEHESDESTLEYLKRWLQPDKVAISTEEVQCLIPPESHPDKQENEEEPPAAQQ